MKTLQSTFDILCIITNHIAKCACYEVGKLPLCVQSWKSCIRKLLLLLLLLLNGTQDALTSLLLDQVFVWELSGRSHRPVRVKRSRCLGAANTEST